MFHRVTCPSCQHKFTIPEGDVGKLANCPNCQSPFRAGKSVAEPDVPMKLQTSPAAAGINKTMLGEVEPPIKYNCPRCKKPLESPAIEAGTKKPCPACGQRLQVPAAPKPPAPPIPAINKTMLAMDESIQPVQQAPLPAAAPPPIPAAPTKKKAEPSERPQPTGAGRFYTMVTVLGGGVFLLSILACVGVMMVSGGESPEMKQMRQDYQKAMQVVEDMKRESKEKELLLAAKREYEQKEKLMWDKFAEEQRIQQAKWDYQREIDLKNAIAANDKIAAAKLEDERRRKQEDADRLAREKLLEKERNDQAVKNEIAALKAQVDAANQKAQQAQIIVTQPPPPAYYPPWHYRNYWGW